MTIVLRAECPSPQAPVDICCELVEAANDLGVPVACDIMGVSVTAHPGCDWGALYARWDEARTSNSSPAVASATPVPAPASERLVPRHEPEPDAYDLARALSLDGESARLNVLLKLCGRLNIPAFPQDGVEWMFSACASAIVAREKARAAA